VMILPDEEVDEVVRGLEQIFDWLNKFGLIRKKVRSLSLSWLVELKRRRSNNWLGAEGSHVILVLGVSRLISHYEMGRGLANR
jgi:hypothetical protein